MRRRLSVFYAFIAAAIIVIWGDQSLWGSFPAPIPGVLGGAVVLAAGCGTHLIRRGAARQERFDEPDSVEREIASQAKTQSFGDVVLGCVLLGSVLLVLGSAAVGLTCIGVGAAGLISFFIRSAYLKRQLNAAR